LVRDRPRDAEEETLDHEEPGTFDWDGHAMNCGEALFEGREDGGTAREMIPQVQNHDRVNDALQVYWIKQMIKRAGH
jgi:hypothetical protein